MLKVSVFFLILFAAPGLQAQVDEEDEDQPKDTIGYNAGRLELNNPPSIVASYTYDPVTDRYIYTNNVGNFNVTYPIILTPKEYEQLVLKESMHKYFKEKADAIDGKKPGSEDAKRDLLPKYYVNNSFFETIFGSNTIDVKPTGSVEMDLGVRYTKQDNPAFSPRNRSAITFDFQQRISVALQGKVGTRLNVNANYDTQSTFAFQNLIKLEYAPTEDDILQKIEVGNVSMPLNSTLIKGAQSLFGVKAQFQFGKTTITGVYSEQKSQTKAVVAQGGGTVQDFDLFALDYDSDRHFFLSQYFRNQYDAALRTYPNIDSRVQITRIEVWVTNKQNRVTTQDNNLRNIVALQDLGESRVSNKEDAEIVNISNPSGFFNPDPINPSGPAIDLPSDNRNNKYNPDAIGTPNGYLKDAVREVATTNNDAFSFPPVAPPVQISEGQDYVKLENARKLTATEFTYNPQLGYISLQQRLANDEVLAVAYEYTIGGEVYKVGEFGNGGVESTVVNGTIPQNQTIVTQSLILKLLKSNLTNVEKTINTPSGPVTYTTPIWNLMMKNIYQVAPGGQLEQEDFRFNILYSDPSPLNYITPVGTTTLPADVTNTPLLKVFRVDRLNATNDPQLNSDGTYGDGFFDFIPNVTIDSQNGRIMFTTVEPFGEYLFNKLRTSPAEDYDGDSNIDDDYNANQRKYVFRTMYRSTQAKALQESEKNKFELRGKYKSTAGDGIAIGAYNVPRGSVVVTAGGRVLQEGLDYSVNYQLGRVIILDPALATSNVPINISVENNSVFGQQTRRFFGLNVEHKFSDKFVLGATFLKMSERPFTQKSNYGQESVNNTIFGFNGNFATEVPFLTRLVNKLPNLDTDVPSNFSFRGEVAWLKPGTPKADRFEGESTIYVDDFEGSQTTIDMKSPLAWSLSSVPAKKDTATNPDFGESLTGLDYGYKRAKLSWYTIDPVFYTSDRPGELTDQDLAFNATRRVYIQELFNQDIADGQQNVLNTLDLSYYPEERGPYNFNPAANGTNTLPNPQDNFGGIMRAISSTNFEQSNVEYIQFWMMDPYYPPSDPNSENPANTGEVYFNLGEISEDVLKDGRKQYENGLPEANSQQATTPSVWGRIPASQSLIYAFDTSEANRAVQDVGFDGLTDIGEIDQFPAFGALKDPAADNYEFYLSADGDVLQRYKNYNGLEKNSPVNVSDNNRGNSTLPDAEDINRDNTMGTIDAYYQYKIDVKPNMQTGENYITNAFETNSRVPGPGNQTIPVRWIQFKIPIDQGRTTPKVGSIEDFRSVRFMRMFMTKFTQPITVRFGTLDLVRGEWRRYANSLEANNDDPEDDPTSFDVLAVNVQENGDREPINYVTPPNVVREQLYSNNTVINQNEQSLSLRVNNLLDGDSRGVFKNIDVDMRQYKRLKMFLHGESQPTPQSPVYDNQLAGFLRFGNDIKENYYEIVLPLKITVPGATSVTADQIWPEENELDLKLDLLTKLKVYAMSHPEEFVNQVLTKSEEELDPSAADKPNKLTLSIKGNPNFGQVRTVMVGIKNNTLTGLNTDGTPLTPTPVTGEVWFNELRLSEMDNKGGMAAVASMDTNFADFMTLSATGKMSTIGFGALEDGANERSREDQKQYSIVTNVSLGKLLPKKWGIVLPFNYGVGEEIVKPQYDPYNRDILLDLLLNETPSVSQRNNIENRAIEYTKNTSINFIGVKKERGADQKQHIYDPENITLSHSFNETLKHDFEIEEYVDQQVRSTVDYSFNFQPKAVEPFKKTKFMSKSSYWKLLSDFNFNYLPSSLTFSSSIIRQYNRQQFRQVEGIEGIAIDPLYRRNFMFNYQYGFNYNLTKNLKINYTGASNNIVKNYFDALGRPIDAVTIYDDYWNTGQPNQHTQQLTLNYELPLNKLPFLSFIKSTYTYTGDYSWQRASEATSNFEARDGTFYNLGNTIQNNGAHRLNTTLNFELLYKYLGLTKSKTPAKGPAKNAAPPKPGQKVTNTQPVAQNERNVIVDGLIGVLTSLKNLQVNYTETSGTVLPGYLPGIGFFGTSKPTLGFVFGSQSDVRYEAAKRGWLTDYQEFNQNFTQVTSKNLDMTASMDLFPDFKIDLTGNRSYGDNFSEQFDVSADGRYNSRSPYNFGNFSISTVLIKTAFSASDENGSAIFDEFRDNRLVIARRVAARRGYDPFIVDADGYPVGFGKNSQEVLLPAFLAAYSGNKPSSVALGAFRDVPIPNWNIKYSGLMRYKFFKDRFKRFSLQHGYKASYTVNSFRSNFEYDKNPNGVDVSGNVNPKLLISNVNLVEQFNPLIKVDMEMKNSMKVTAEVKKDRALSMSFDNNLLTEVQGMDYSIGLGYRIKDVIFNSALADNPQGIIKSDINIKADLSLRDSKTIVRYLDYDNNQLAGGQNLWNLKLTADYSFSKNLTAIFFYDHSFTKAVISTAFPITNIRAGFTLRYNFGN
ncbi:MAG: cell surface protein SprA [Flavobacterium sp. BFFFF1]|uniref:T9SS outer membrane translocon Sov/SprA n=1 Tax=unclassified Flavobacterium TaxID=196869 RepID=UPI000BDDBF23|nr:MULTISPECIES: cell surface protein SprA [unclassified Flavobacterium]OYU82360.1 MAG: cell surface protein SprA [Flavobacterium sp. BFFFF1]